MLLLALFLKLSGCECPVGHTPVIPKYTLRFKQHCLGNIADCYTLPPAGYVMHMMSPHDVCVLLLRCIWSGLIEGNLIKRRQGPWLTLFQLPASAAAACVWFLILLLIPVFVGDGLECSRFLLGFCSCKGGDTFIWRLATIIRWSVQHSAPLMARVMRTPLMSLHLTMMKSIKCQCLEQGCIHEVLYFAFCRWCWVW